MKKKAQKKNREIKSKGKKLSKKKTKRNFKKKTMKRTNSVGEEEMEGKDSDFQVT